MRSLGLGKINLEYSAETPASLSSLCASDSLNSLTRLAPTRHAIPRVCACAYVSTCVPSTGVCARSRNRVTVYRDGDRHTWCGFLGLIDDEIKAICRSRAVLLGVCAPSRLRIVEKRARMYAHAHTRCVPLLAPPIPWQFYFSTHTCNLRRPLLPLFPIILDG